MRGYCWGADQNGRTDPPCTAEPTNGNSLRITEEPKGEDGVHSADSQSDGHRAEDSRMARQSLAAAMATDQPAAGLTGTEQPKQNI